MYGGIAPAPGFVGAPGGFGSRGGGFGLGGGGGQAPGGFPGVAPNVMQSPWEEIYDSATDSSYWVNSATGAFSWTNPNGR